MSRANPLPRTPEQKARYRAKRQAAAYAYEKRVRHGMLTRCRNPNHHSYERYGTKGIKVCQRWQESFANFLADMGPAPSPKHSIDRIDGRGDYEPDNCRWATATVQSRNTTHARAITFDGQTHCITEWAEVLGISKKVLTDRLNKQGWSVEKALTTPIMRNRRPKSAGPA